MLLKATDLSPELH